MSDSAITQMTTRQRKADGVSHGRLLPRGCASDVQLRPTRCRRWVDAGSQRSRRRSTRICMQVGLFDSFDRRSPGRTLTLVRPATVTRRL